MSWHPAYLVHGDAHGRIGERRANLRRKAEEASGTGSVETLEGDDATPEAVAAALAAMPFAMGRRFIVVDGAERWKADDVKKHIAPALKTMSEETTIAFFAREDGRAKVPTALIDAVKKVGGAVAKEETPKAKDLPRWLIGEAEKLGMSIDGAAARVLVDQVGDRQQRLLRELEKLGLEHGKGARLGIEEVEAAAAVSAEHQVWGFVDALVAGDREAATRTYLELRAQGEALPRLIPSMARRVREVLHIAAQLEAGTSVANLKDGLKMPPWMVDRRIREARQTDADTLRRAMQALSELELASRGLADVSEDTAALRAIDLIAA